MTKPMLLADFTRLPAVARAVTLDGLSGLIDVVATQAPATHRFLRYQWYAAAIATYGGDARTIVVESEGDPVITLPITRVGPRWMRLAAVPGNPAFRSFPTSILAGQAAFEALVDQLSAEISVLQIGPVREGDRALAPLLATARARGWIMLDRRSVARASGADTDCFWRNAAEDQVLADMAEANPALDDGDAPGREHLLARPGLPALFARALGSFWIAQGR